MKILQVELKNNISNFIPSSGNFITKKIDNAENNEYRKKLYDNSKLYIKSIKYEVVIDDIKNAIKAIKEVKKNRKVNQKNEEKKSLDGIYRYILPDQIYTSNSCNDVLREVKWNLEISTGSIKRKKINSDYLTTAMLMNENEVLIYYITDLTIEQIIYSNNHACLTICNDFFEKVWKLGYNYDFLIESIHKSLSDAKTRHILQFTCNKSSNLEMNDGIPLKVIQSNFNELMQNICNKTTALEKSGLVTSKYNDFDAKHKIKPTALGNIIEEQRRTLEFIIRNVKRFEENEFDLNEIPLHLRNSVGLLYKSEVIEQKDIQKTIDKVCENAQKFILLISEDVDKIINTSINTKCKPIEKLVVYKMEKDAYYKSNSYYETTNTKILSSNDINFSIISNESEGVIMFKGSKTLAFYGSNSNFIKWCLLYYAYLTNPLLQYFN